MKKLRHPRSLIVVFILSSVFAACQNSDSSRNDNSIIPGPIQENHLNGNINETSTANQVSCLLNNGQTTSCYKFVFSSNPVASGPFCPESVDDAGGLGIYDGETNPGFNTLHNIFTFMEADGYDVIDENGYTRIQDPGDRSAAPEEGKAYCLDAAADDSLTITYLIPVTPVLLDTPDSIDTVELFGFSLDGVPINGNPPSVVSNEGKPGGGGGDGTNSSMMGPPSSGSRTGSMPPPPGAGSGSMGPPTSQGSGSGMGGGGTGIVAIPALDPCGGHHDPAGYYHWHMIPEAANDMLEKNGITSVTCTNIAQNPGAMSGYAKDGFPVYGPVETDGTRPENLDECNGHTTATPEFPEGVYHYHSLDGQAPGIPGCVKGASAVDAYSVE